MDCTKNAKYSTKLPHYSNTRWNSSCLVGLPFPVITEAPTRTMRTHRNPGHCSSTDNAAAIPCTSDLRHHDILGPGAASARPSRGGPSVLTKPNRNCTGVVANVQYAHGPPTSVQAAAARLQDGRDHERGCRGGELTRCFNAPGRGVPALHRGCCGNECRDAPITIAALPRELARRGRREAHVAASSAGVRGGTVKVGVTGCRQGARWVADRECDGLRQGALL